MNLFEASEEEILADFAEHQNDPVWIHYSNVPQLTINPKPNHRDPAGIYLFPENFTPAPMWRSYKYRFKVKLDPSTKVLDLSKITADEAIEISKKLGIPPTTIKNFRVDEKSAEDVADRFWDLLCNYFIMTGKRGPGAWNKALRSVGYDAVFDDTQAIHVAEDQLLILDPRKIKVLDMETQAGIGFDQVKRAVAYLQKAAEEYGTVTVREPKKEKQTASYDTVLTGYVRIESGDKYAEWKIIPYKYAGEKIPLHLSIHLSSANPRIMSDRSYGSTFDAGKLDIELKDFVETEFKIAMQKIFLPETVSSGQLEVDVEPRRKTDIEGLPPVYQFGKVISNDIQLSYTPDELDTRGGDFKYRSGFAYTFLPARIKLYRESFGDPDLVHVLMGPGNALHAVFFEVGDDMIHIWDRGNILSEFAWKSFERQAQDAGYKIKRFSKGSIEDCKGYWLTESAPQIQARAEVIQASAQELASKFETVFESDAYFRNWLDALIPERSLSDWAENFGVEDFEGGDYEDGFKDESEKEAFEEGARAELDSQMSNFISTFEKKATIRGNQIELYRVINITDFDKFYLDLKKGKYQKGYNGLGVYWSWDKNRADSHWGGKGESIVMTALAPISKIDIEATLNLNLHPSLGEDEAEIRLQEKTKIQVTTIERADKDEEVIPEAPLQVVADKENIEPELDSIVQKYLKLFGDSSVPVPKIEIRNHFASPWLGRCTFNVNQPGTSTIEIQKEVLADPVLTEKVLAHEMVHHLDYMQHQIQIIKDMNRGIRRTNGHGEFFQKWADKINQIMGEGFVSEKSDGPVRTEVKEYFLLIEPNKDRFTYAIAVRLSAQQKEQVAKHQGACQARLIKSTDPRFMHGAPIKLYGGMSAPRDAETQQKLKELYEAAGAQIQVPEKQAASVEAGTEAWKKEGYTIKGIFQDNSDPTSLISVYAYSPSGEVIGSVRFDNSGVELHPSELEINKEHRRKGLASAMYAYAEKVTGAKVVPGEDQSSDAKKLWNQPNRSFGSVQDLTPRTIIAYHGSNQPIKKFDSDFSNQGVFWFSEDKDKILRGESGASSSQYLIKVELKVTKTAGWEEYEKLGLGQIEDLGFDSIQLDDDWVIFDSKNIKVLAVTSQDPKTPVKASDDKKRLEQKYGSAKQETCVLWWGVKIDGDDSFHITCKWLGDSPYTVEQIKELFAEEGCDPSPFEITRWEAVTFDTPNDGQVKVLEILDFPDRIKRCHYVLEMIRSDDHPYYRAHITVPDDLWQRVKDGLKPSECSIQMGPLEVMQAKKCIYRFDETVEASLEEGYEEIDFDDVMYHGSVEPVANWDVNAGSGQFGKGLYLTPDKKIAEFHAQGGRQGRSGQVLKTEPGHLYSFWIKGHGVQITDEYEFYKTLVSDSDEAEEAFRQSGSLDSKKVTGCTSEWAFDNGYDFVLFDPKDSGVLTPFVQMLVISQKVIRQTKELVEGAHDDQYLIARLRDQAGPADESLISGRQVALKAAELIRQGKESKPNLASIGNIEEFETNQTIDKSSQDHGKVGTLWTRRTKTFASGESASLGTTESGLSVKVSGAKLLTLNAIGSKRILILPDQLDLIKAQLQSKPNITPQTLKKFSKWLISQSSTPIAPVTNVQTYPEAGDDCWAVNLRARVDDSPFRVVLTAYHYESMPDDLLVTFHSVIDKSAGEQYPKSFEDSSCTSIGSNYEDEGFVGDNWGSQGSGVLFHREDRILLMKRSASVVDPNLWGIPGGAVPIDEQGKPKDVKESAFQESDEEMGGLPSYHVTKAPVVFNKGKFKYTTFLAEVSDEFSPILNWEHSDFAWFDLMDLPKGIHPGVQWAIDQFFFKPSPHDEDSVTASSEINTAEFLDAVEQVADEAGFAFPEKAYFQCSDFSFAVAILGQELDLPVKLYSCQMISKFGHKEVPKGSTFAHTFLGIDGTYYDYTARQVDPEIEFPHVFQTDPQYKGIHEIKSPKGLDDGSRFWYERIAVKLGLISQVEAKTITEAGLSKILYHLTGLDATQAILQQNRFRLTTMLGTPSDRRGAPEDHFYYLSTSRSKMGSYNFEGREGSVQLVLDGEKLHQKYKGNPMDYWGPEYRKINPSRNEMEDRIWSRERYIEPAIPYIREIYVFVPSEDQPPYAAVWRTQLTEILKIAKENSIPIYLYRDRKDFSFLNKAKAIDPASIDLEVKEAPETSPRYSGKYTKEVFQEFEELFQKDKVEDLSRKAQDMMYRMGWNPDDLIQTLSADVHNYKRDEMVDLLVKLARRHKLKSIEEMVMFLRKKWHPDAKASVQATEMEGGIQDIDYPYFHVSNHPETPTIHKTTTRGGTDGKYYDPYGIYLFIKGEHIDVSEWGEKKYRWDAKIKRGAKIRLISGFDQSEKWSLMESIGIKTGLDVYNALKKAIDEEDKIEFEYLQEQIEDVEGNSRKPTLEIMQKVFKDGIQDVMWFRTIRSFFNNREKFTQFWKSQGIDGLEDDAQAFYAGEPQLVILNPDVIEWGDREDNQSDKKVYRVPPPEKKAAAGRGMYNEVPNEILNPIPGMTADPWEYSGQTTAATPQNLPQDVIEAFTELGNEQRGEPEEAMLEIQRFHSGVLSYCVEHAGDLTHRMTHMARYGQLGRDYILNKGGSVLQILQNPYGFVKEHEENVANNAKSKGISIEQYNATLNGLLKTYADAHRRLTVYNGPQFLAKRAAVTLGEKRFEKTKDILDTLLRIANNESLYEEQASSVQRDPSGKIQPYTGLTPEGAQAESIKIQSAKNLETTVDNSFLPRDLVMTDCEMTGVVPDRDKLLQIAMIKLKLDGNQYVEYDEPLVLYMQHDGEPENDFQKKYLSHIFKQCNDSTLQPEEAKQQIHEWLGDLRGTVTPCGDCVPTDIDFMRHAGVIDTPDIGDDGPIPGSFHYEYFDMNGIKAIARHKAGKKEDKKELAGYDEEGIHDGLVDCRNQTKEFNHHLKTLLGGEPVQANSRIAQTESNFKPVLKDSTEIADYIEVQSADEVDREMIEDLFAGCSATLKRVPLDQISSGPENNNLPDASKEKKYLKMSVDTMPPLVLDENLQIIDGNHRKRVAEKLGLKEVWAYVIDEEQTPVSASNPEILVIEVPNLPPETTPLPAPEVSTQLDLPESVLPTPLDDFKLDDTKKAMLQSFDGKAQACVTFEDFQALLSKILIELQLTEDYRKSVAGILNKKRKELGLDLL
jgi:oligoribonuclease (3'-5' exoribonuclease)/8-oxo-dGTP pyrophosphatase MutT (NUDIX family)